MCQTNVEILSRHKFDKIVNHDMANHPFFQPSVVRISFCPKISNLNIWRIWRNIFQDSDGKLDYDEFVKMMLQY